MFPKIAQELPSAWAESLSWILNRYTVVYPSLQVFFGGLAKGYHRDRNLMPGVGSCTPSAAASACATRL